MTRRRRNEQPTTLRDALGSVTGSLGLGQPDVHIRVMGVWQRCVDEPMRSQLRPAHLRNGVLTVHTDNSAWASQAKFLAAALLQKLQDDGLEVSEIRVVLVHG
ncbi:MAG: DUF721 domain-containing protein [Acidimicrobiia bacterium]